MSLFISCPKCEARLSIKREYLGRKIRCTGCETVLQLPEKLPEVEPEAISVNPQAIRKEKKKKREEEDDDYEQEERNDGLEYVASGLNLHFWKVMIQVVSIVVIFFGILFGGALLGGMRNANPQAVANVAAPIGILVIFFAVLMIAALVVGIIGSILCCRTPDQTQKPWIIAALVLEILAIAISIFSQFMDDQLAAGVLNFLQSICFGVSLSIFLNFIAKTAEYIHKKRLAEYAHGTKKLWYIIIGMMCGFLVFMIISALTMAGMAGQRNPGAGNAAALGIALLMIVFGLAMIVMGIWFLIRYMRTLLRARDSIRNYIG